MKTLRFIAVAFVLATLASCTPKYKTIDSVEYYTIEIPDRFTDMSGQLNGQADIEYGYVDETVAPAKENYLIIITETHDEIESYELDFEFDVQSYSELCIMTLEEGLDEFEVINDNSKVSEINGMEVVVSEMRGSLYTGQGLVSVYYYLGVFRGETGYYQVLSWCIEDQKSEFKEDMKHMIDSFKEK